MISVDFCSVFLSNPIYDSRLVNLDESLTKNSKSTAVVGFDWFEKSKKISKTNWFIFKIKRRPACIFYSKFIFLAFIKLKEIKAKTYIAEDVYSLPIVVFWAKIRKAKILYNSREFYFALGGLSKRPKIQKLISWIENKFIKSVDFVLATGEMDKEILEKQYQISNVRVIRNIPKMTFPTSKIDFREKYNLSNDCFIMIYQGILQEGRGIKLVLNTISEIDDIAFIIVGDGPKSEEYKKIVEEKRLESKVFFIGLVEHKELINYSASADIGLSLIENISLSYFYALPNKLFEYINSGIPILSSDLPQMKQIIEKYKIGRIVNLEHKPEANLKNEIQIMRDNPQYLLQMKSNTIRAVQELNWDVEFERNIDIFQ
jgi:glycosyltransferase involved in cell wall biosynthesis